jgi:two-component system sensor histidine kinase CpxA
VRSLFIRIFLWFWAATVLLVAVLIGSVYLTEPDVTLPRWRLSHTFVQLYSQDAAAIYDNQGCHAVEAFFDRQEPFPELDLRRNLTDTQGKDLCGEKLPAQASDLARRAAAANSSKFIRETGKTLIASPTLGPKNQRYVLLYDLPHGRPSAYAVPLQTWLFRILALLVTAGLVCYGLARYFASPIRSLRVVARQFASGDLTARVGNDSFLKRRDEVSELGKDFDEMARRIEELITRQEQLLQSQRRLLGDISHELRSPLTRLALASGLLQRRVTADAMPLLNRIDRESERLNTLIGQLLTLARLDTIPQPEELEPVDLKELLEEIAADAAFEAIGRSIRIDLQAEQVCQIEGSRELLHSALENVLRNALHYTNEGTTVTVELQCSHSSVSVTVSDCGPGVPEQDLAHVFEPFYRVAEARDRQSGGTGLGLAITNRAIQLHGGSVEAFNRPKGGLSVCISFPISRVSRVEPPLAPGAVRLEIGRANP